MAQYLEYSGWSGDVGTCRNGSNFLSCENSTTCDCPNLSEVAAVTCTEGMYTTKSNNVPDEERCPDL